MRKMEKIAATSKTCLNLVPKNPRHWLQNSDPENPPEKPDA